MPVSKRRVAVAIALTLVLSGCGSRWFTDREQNPVVEDYLSEGWTTTEMGVLSYKPSRSSVFVNMDEGQEDRYLNICAQGAADVVDALDRERELSLQGQSASGATGGLSASSSITTALLQLTQRSQGIQFARDQVFALCIDHLSRRIENHDYVRLREKVIDSSANLIALEINRLPELARPVSDAIGKSVAAEAATAAAAAP